MYKLTKMRRFRPKFALLSLTVFLLSIGTLGSIFYNPLVGQDSEMSAFLDRLADRISSYPLLERWTASVHSQVEEMDKHWKPKKTTLVKKKVTIDGINRTEAIQQALELKKGKTRDITQEYIKEVKKEEEKARKRAAKGKGGGRQKRQELTRSQIFPFDKEQRKNLRFSFKEESIYNGIPVILLESRSTIKDEDVYTGTYTIARDSLDVLRVDLSPTKKPAILKTVEMALEFQVLPEGFQTIKRTWFKMHLNVVIKVIRLEAEEEYSDIKVLQ